MEIKEKILNNWLVRKAYSTRFYLNLGIAQIGWFTGKLPEIMAFVYLSEWFGFELSKNMLIVFGVGVVVGLTIAGYIWKHSGLYDVECHVNNQKNPVSDEIFRAARIINKRWGEK